VATTLWLRGHRRPASLLWVAAAGIAYVCSLVPVGEALLLPLESQFQPVTRPASLPPVHYIVVLGSGYVPRSGVSPVAALDCDGLRRLVEAVRIMRAVPGARLVLSGGAPVGRVPSALGYAQLAVDLGLDATSLMVLTAPVNTDGEAHAIAAAVGSQPFLLITSAWHMPRAMRLMNRVHAHAIPLPTAQLTGIACGPRWFCLLPSSAGLRETESAIHEYLGLAALDLNLE
jgi:uncharacterized SAM-binding protein YcdF (DUF218 family)